MVAGLTAVLLLMPAILGILLLGLGLAGLTPWFTAWAFLRRARQAAEIAMRECPAGEIGLLEIAGFLSAFVIPIGFAAGVMSLLGMSGRSQSLELGVVATSTAKKKTYSERPQKNLASARTNGR